MPEWLMQLLNILKWPGCVASVTVAALLLFRKGILKRLNSIKQAKVKKGGLETVIDFEKDETEKPQKYETKPKLIDEEAPEEEEIPKKSKPEKPEDWFSEMIKAFTDRDTNKAKEYYGKLRESEKDKIRKLKYDAIYQSNLYIYGLDSAGLDNLRELTKNEKISAFAWYRIGRCYEENGEYSKACAAYENAVEVTSNDEQYTQYIIRLANCLYLNGNKLEAFNILSDNTLLTSDSDSVYKVFEALGDLYDEENDPLSRALALELALESNPSNTSIKFDAAYSYSDTDLPLLSMLHYKNLTNISADNYTAINNLGVIYEELELNLKSVDCYKKAADNKLTIAAANLSKTYSRSGFKREAMKLTKNVKKLGNITGPIAEAITALLNKEEKEEKEETELLSKALEEQRFLRRFGRAYIHRTDAPPSIEGTWQIPRKGELIIEQDRSSIQGSSEWDHELLKIEGRIKNRGVLLKTTKGKYYPKHGKGYGIIINGNREIDVMYVYDNDAEFEKLTKLD